MDNKLSPLKRLVRLVKADRKDITRIVLFAGFAGLINLSLPLGVQAIITYLSGGYISTSWVVLVVLVIFGVLLAGVMQAMQLYLSETIQQRIFQRSAFEFAVRIPRIRLEQVASEYTPELINRFFDTLSLQKGLSKVLLEIGAAGLQIFFGLILLSFYHPFFILFGITLLLVLYLVIRYTGPAGLRTSINESTYKYKVAYWLEELARTMNTFKLAGNSTLPISRTDGLVANYLSERRKHFKILLIQYMNIVGFKAMITGGLLIIGSLLVLDNQINLGQFVAAEIIIILVINSVEKIMIAMEPIYDVLTALEKIGLVTDLKLERETGVLFEPDEKNKPMRLAMRDLKYGKSILSKPIINGINLDVEAGERMLIHGYNESGRTTLVELISGLYQNYEGSILFDNKPASSLELCSLRCNIGDSLNEEDLFYGSIEDNITLGKPNFDRKRLIQVCEQINLYDYIKRLPDGFDTFLSPRGKELPEYIARKIKIARSIIEQPPLVVWQESLHVFSKKDKKLITECMTSRQQPWTLVVSSGSSQIASQCDRIVLLKEGRIIFNGTYTELQQHEDLLELFYD